LGEGEEAPVAEEEGEDGSIDPASQALLDAAAAAAGTGIEDLQEPQVNMAGIIGYLDQGRFIFLLIIVFVNFRVM
jgi:hypothetical protein